MGRLDVVASLLRSTARGAASRVRASGITAALQKLLGDVAPGRTVVSSAQLTAAVARCPGVTAATVSATRDALRVEISLDDGSQRSATLRLAAFVFAAGGAKELSFEVDPERLVHDGACQEVTAAIASEIARALWRPALGRAPQLAGRALVTSEPSRAGHGARLVVDLRSVPQVRWAQRQRLPSAMVEMLRPRSLAFTDAGVELQLALDGLPGPR